MPKKSLKSSEKIKLIKIGKFKKIDKKNLREGQYLEFFDNILRVQNIKNLNFFFKVRKAELLFLTLVPISREADKYLLFKGRSDRP